MKRLLVLLLSAAVLGAGLAGPSQATGPVGDPAGWTDRQLALRLVMAGFDMGRTRSAEPWVREGLGGVVLFGRPPADLGRRLAELRAAGAPAPLVGSDEEGGKVQRLKGLLPRLPSAESLGSSRSPKQVRGLAASYGQQMRSLGVDMDLGPVADLGVPGFYIAQTDRAFSADPRAVAAYAGAWQAGMRDAGVVPVAKHWPGHGSAANTHTRPASTPPLAALEARDLLPFAALLEAGVPAVMVGHLSVPGLTEPGVPATLSPSAYRYLRERAGQSRLLMTDSMSMGAIRSGLGLSPGAAAVRALQAGADMILVDDGPGPLVDAISGALADGSYPRTSAVASARRVLAVSSPAAAPAVSVPSPPPGPPSPPSPPPAPPPPPPLPAPPAPEPVAARPEVSPPPGVRISRPDLTGRQSSPAVGLGRPRPLRLAEICDCGVAGALAGAGAAGGPPGSV